MTKPSKRSATGREPVDPRQQDLFSDDRLQSLPAATGPIAAPPRKVARTGASQQPVSKVRAATRLKSQSPPPSFSVNDDWWTTRAVCAFLKIGRKALWVMRRDPASDFPAPVDVVGHRHLYLAAEVRAWMDAQRDKARLREQDRRRALRQFSTRAS